jgi:branched-chain amino acid transport system permease protein
VSEASATAAGTTATPVFRVTQQTLLTRLTAVAGLALLAVLATLPAWGNAGTQKLLVEVLTLLAMAQMWNLLAGFAGLVSIGQQAFIGLGAYALFYLTTLAHLPVLPALALTGGFIAVVALVTALFVFRLQGGYFAIGTWVIAEVFRLIVSQSRDLGAGTGTTIQALVRMDPVARQALTYWLALAVGFGSIAVVALIMRSRVGLALAAVRDSEVAARSLGVDVFRTKLLVYLVAAVGCGVAGAVIYMQLLRIQPTAAFGVDWTARMIFIVIIGGLGRIEGPIVGTLVFFLLQELLADYGAVYLIILGAVAVAVTLLAPRGLWGLVVARLPLTLFGVQRRLIIGRQATTGAWR